MKNERGRTEEGEREGEGERRCEGVQVGSVWMRQGGNGGWKCENVSRRASASVQAGESECKQVGEHERRRVSVRGSECRREYEWGSVRNRV